MTLTLQPSRPRIWLRAITQSRLPLLEMLRSPPALPIRSIWRSTPAPSSTTTTLTGSLSTAVLGQRVSFTAIVASQDSSAGLDGAVSFAIDGETGPDIPLQLVDGRQVAIFTTSTVAVGMHTVTASFSGTQAFASSASNTVNLTIDTPDQTTPTATVVTVPAVAADGPLVMDLQRFGYHSQPTVVVLTFDKDLAPSGADNAANYKIVSVGPGGSLGPAIGIKRIAYDPADRTVTLHPSHRLNVHKRFELIVDGTSRHA